MGNFKKFFPAGSAPFVVADGQARFARGRCPRLRYADESSPRAAYAAALRDLAFLVGDDYWAPPASAPSLLERAVKMGLRTITCRPVDVSGRGSVFEVLCETAAESGRPVFFRFNGRIPLLASPSTTPVELHAALEEGFKRQEVANADRLRRYREVRAARFARYQAKLDRLVVALDGIDPNDYVAMVRWLVRIAPFGDNNKLDFPWERLLTVLRSRGFGDVGTPVNVESTRAARDLIGQVVSSLANDPHGILGCIRHYGEEWLRKFVPASA